MNTLYLHYEAERTRSAVEQREPIIPAGSIPVTYWCR